MYCGLRGGALLLALAAAGLFCSPNVGAATFTVTNNGDTNGMCLSGECSLREAITAANSTPGLDSITFNIYPGGSQTIQPTTQLPTLTGPTIVDGTTQPGFDVESSAPIIELDGFLAEDTSGLLLEGGSTVRGLVVNRFGGHGIVLLPSEVGSNTIVGNYIGTDLTGALDRGNGASGVFVNTAQHNHIGGTAAADRNVISGNQANGILLSASLNVVSGNRIGTTASGLGALPNDHGIRIFDGTGNTIGGTTAGDRNLISGNVEHGILVDTDATHNTIQGNYIGTTVNGMAALPNGREGVRLEGDENILGGTSASERNILSGNGGFGVLVYGSNANVVQGNYAGTDVLGTSAIGNGIDGIGVDGGTNHTIGGTAPGAGNLTSANQNQGIAVFGVDFASTTGSTIQGNLVGTKVDGSSALGNGGDGVRLYNASNITVGGSTAAAANTIAYNGTESGRGVAVFGTGSNNTIRHNSIFSNGHNAVDLGIDLGRDGVTPNDSGDDDVGVNGLRNFPLISTATSAGGITTVAGSYASVLPGTYHLEFFSSPSCDTSGNGEGKSFVGELDKTITLVPESVFFNSVFEVSTPVESVITATATDAAGNTSEFSPCAGVAGGAPPVAAISLESLQPSVIAGAQTVPINGISLSKLTESNGSQQATPLDGIPLDGIDLALSPLDGIPLDGIGLTPQLLQQALGGVHLSDIPLSKAGGWDAVLAGTALAGVPLNTVTLADVYALPNPPTNGISLGQIDFSATPLDGIPLAGLALGPRLLSQIPLDQSGPNDAAENLADWCAQMNAEPGHPCASPASLQGETLIGATVKGLPLDGIPLDGIPLDGIPLDGIPLDGIPLDGIDLTGTPLDGIPLDGIDFAVSPLDGIPLDGIDITGSPLDGIPLDGISVATRDQVVDCVTAGFVCSGKTLGQAKVAGRLRPGAKLGMLDGALGNITLGQLVDALLGSFGLSLADLAKGLPEPPQRTLHDLLAVLLGKAGYHWSDLNLNAFPIAQHSPDGGLITYRATVSVTGGLSPTTATIHAAVPDGGIYKAGSTTLVEKVSQAVVPLGDPTLEESQLQWKPNIAVGTEYELTWQVHAPIELGDHSISANVRVPGMAAAALSAPVSVEVTQTLEPNNVPGTGPALADKTLYLSYMLQGDVDRYVVPIPSGFGSRVKITLSHVAAGTDLDLTVAGPPPPALRTAPANSVPLQNAQWSDTAVKLDQPTQALPPETLQDVPTDAITTGSNVVRATSDNRGSADEEVTLVSQGETGQYVVQVSDYQGDSALPYMLEVEVSGPPNLGACAARSFANAGQGAVGAIPIVPANVNTLILVNRKRLGDTYGTTGMNDVMARLNQLAGRSDLGIVGAVVPVDGDPDVANAYNAWDGNPCSPEAANRVVRQIGQLIDRLEPSNLRYKVVVGGDDQIPFGRVPDETLIANESSYVDTLTGPNNQYKGAFGYGFLMTDDVYAEQAAPQLFGHELFVPDQALGRVLETPGEITGMIDAFLLANGAVAPQRSLVTGYDFLTDGSNDVNSPFASAFGANAKTLISESWVAKDPLTGDVSNDLEDALFPPSNAPQLNSINAHFDHTRLLPAAENAAHRSANLYVSQDVRDRGAAAVAQRVLFSMGCHSGLSISDAIYAAGDPVAKDWAQTWLAGGAFAWIGNTGYGLGDTVEVAYTERLHALFSGKLNGSLTLGEALAQAKQEYLSQLGIVGGYDAKVVMEATLFGLPMLKLGAGTPPADPATLPTQTDPATGLQAASFSKSPTFTPVTKPEGKFYRAQTTQATNRRPIEPALNFDVTKTGKVAHGIVITSLHSGPDEQPFDAAFSRVVTDDSGDELELVGEASYPSKIQSLSTFSSFTSPTATRQNAVLIAGLYRSDGVPDPSGIGIHRLYDQIGGYVLYADPGVTDFTPPELGALETQNIGSGVGFAVNVTDAGGSVKDVKVIYRDCSGTWRLSTLQRSGGDRWSGGGAIAAGCNQVDYYLQAVDDAGNVAVSSRKVTVEPLTLPPATGATPITITPTGTVHASGWYTGPVTVTVSPSAGTTYSLEDGAFQPYTTPFLVGGDGVHVVKAKAQDGSTKTAGFAIDTTNPTVLMTTPAPGAVYVLDSVVRADYTCADAGSGAQSCTGTPASGQPLDTTSLGPKTILVTATDAVGRTFTLTRTYTVVYRDILFASSRTGFGDIYAVSSSGGTPTQLTSGPAIDAEPAWSPDRSRIAFTSTRQGNVELYVLELATGVVTRLTTNAAIDTSPAFSPDGARIAFASNRGSGGNWDIYVVSSTGGAATRLTTHSADDLLPTWSPDGMQLAFMSTRTGDGDIYRLNLSSPATSQTRLTTGTSASGIDTEPAWFGDRIAFSTNRHGTTNFELYVVNTSTLAQTRLTNQPGHQITPTWSRDGKRIAFMSSSTGNGDIYVATIPNPLAVIPLAAQTRLTTHAAIDALPDW